MSNRTIAGEGKKSPLNMRTTEALRGKLETAAAQSGRSLVQEVEYRLESSFAVDALIGSNFSGLHQMIALALMLAPKGPTKKRAAMIAINQITEGFFSGPLKPKRVHMLQTASALFDKTEPGSWAGHKIAMLILEQAGLAEIPPPK